MTHEDPELLAERVRRVEAELVELKRRFDFLEARSLQEVKGKSGLLSRLTTKQHVALQMVLAGKSNAEIAERFGVTENGAKVYVRAISKKAGVNTRSQIVMAVFEEMKAVSEEQYTAMSGGLPKGWATLYLEGPVEEDPHAAVYRKGGVI